jgi:hypothetical protein
MSEPNKNQVVKGEKITPTDNPGLWIGKSWRAKISAILTCVINPKYIVPVVDANGITTWQEAQVTMANNGFVVVFPPVSLAAGSSSSIQQFKIISDGGDYWNCKTWDGTTLGSTIIKVAKPFKLRAGTGGIASEAIRTVTYTYTYTPVTVGAVTGYYTRAVSGSDGSSETDYTIPDPIANDIIYALPFSTTTPSTLAAVTWIDINADGRAWAT